MMNNPYNLHSWSKDYRAQVIDAARRRDLIEPARRETHGLRRLDLTRRSALPPLRRRTRTDR